jgi:hypothetical protein
MISKDKCGLCLRTRPLSDLWMVANDWVYLCVRCLDRVEALNPSFNRLVEATCTVTKLKLPDEEEKQNETGEDGNDVP